MTSKDHEHKYVFTKIESCMLESREQIEYYTRQCSVCGLCPTTDYNKYRIQPEKCKECAELLRSGSLLKDIDGHLPVKHFKKLLAIYKLAYTMHQEAVHPERMADDII